MSIRSEKRSGIGAEAASPALIISIKEKSVVSSAAMSTSGWSSVTGSIGTSAEEAEEAAAALGRAGGGLAETGIGGALGRPAVETATVRGPVGGLLQGLVCCATPLY